MEIDKDQIVELMTSKGDHDQATEAENDLPDKVDLEQDKGMLARFGIDPSDLLGRLGGGGRGKLLDG